MGPRTRRSFVAVALLAGALGAGAIVLQRWVATTRFDAIVFVAIWFAVVGAVVAAVAWRRRELRAPLLGAYVAIVVASGAVGYWWGFRDHEVHENVVMASTSVTGAERVAALAPSTDPDGASGSRPGKRERATNHRRDGEDPGRPVSLARGTFAGQDGHAGSGQAEVVRTSGGERLLTFTEFDVDPGAKVVVWLTPDPSLTGDRIELGNLKGNVGDQQYAIPPDADLSEYDTVVLYCTPFTVRIATAELG